jgi:hypothetical protein
VDHIEVFVELGETAADLNQVVEQTSLRNDLLINNGAFDQFVQTVLVQLGVQNKFIFRLNDGLCYGLGSGGTEH